MRSSVFALWLTSFLASEASAFVSQTKSVTRTDSQLFARKPFITGNWKLNPQTKDEAIELATGIANSITPDSPGDIAIFVPFPFLESVQKIAGDKFVVGAEVRSDFRKKKIGIVNNFGFILTAYLINYPPSFLADDHTRNCRSVYRGHLCWHA